MRDRRTGGLRGGDAIGVVDLRLRSSRYARRRPGENIIGGAFFSDTLDHIKKWDVPRIVHCLQLWASSNVVGVDRLGQQLGRRETRQIYRYPAGSCSRSGGFGVRKSSNLIRFEKTDPVHP